MMKTIGLITIALIMSEAACYGQRMPRKNFRLKAAGEHWRTSKKLTLLEEVPQLPRGQRACLSPSNLTDESIGYLECWPYEVMKVVGPNDALLKLNDSSIPPIWLAEFSTKKLVVGDKVRLMGPVEISGTKSYMIDNTQTSLRVVRLISQEAAGKLAAEEKGKEEDALNRTLTDDTHTEEALFRTWTDETGKHTFIGRFVEFKKGRVYLVRKDTGKTINVRLNRLSKEDKKWIRKEMRKATSEKRFN